MSRMHGFTLIELMVTVSIIGILAAISLPAYQVYIQRSEVTEAFSMSSTLRSKIDAHYEQQLQFPASNAAGGMPAPEQLIGNRVTSVVVVDGAIHVTLGNKASQPLQGRILSFRPAVVSGSPTSPIAWLCGYDEAVAGMEAVGENLTDLDPQFLPLTCRKRS